VIQQELQELKRREKVYREGMPEIDVDGRVVILVDDGLATGSTMRAAAQALRKQDPKRLVVAVPVGAPETCDEFRSEVDEVICGMAPEAFYAVGLWYEDFSQTSDEEVQQLLNEASVWSEMHTAGRSS
jgi:predicted phosphoribosyltransferase